MSNKTVQMSTNPRKRHEPDPALLDALVQGKKIAAEPEPASEPIREQGSAAAARQEISVPQTVAQAVAQPTPAAPKEAMKRLTFDIPAPLHKRIRRKCVDLEVDMAVELRRILDLHFPATE